MFTGLCPLAAWKKSILATLPLVAVAVIVMLAGVSNVALFAGLVIEIVGGWLGLTLIATGLEVVVTPKLSVTFAVSW